MTFGRSALAGAALLALLCGTILASSAQNSRMGPHDVVAAVVNALQHNNSPLPNAGILAVYQFASPANKRVTGPYGRFFRSVKSPPYAVLLQPSAIEYGPIKSDANQASQNITIHTPNNEAFTFRFDISRQNDGPCPGCWMVDSVVPVP
jgi:hypothetical protein